MFRQLDDAQVQGLNFIPAAVIGAPVDLFRDRGIHFTRDCDDMDEYEFAPLAIAGDAAFALMHYRTAPENETTLMLTEPQADIAPMIARVAEALDIPVQLFRWHVGGEPARFSSAAD